MPGFTKNKSVIWPYSKGSKVNMGFMPVSGDLKVILLKSCGMYLIPGFYLYKTVLFKLPGIFQLVVDFCKGDIA